MERETSTLSVRHALLMFASPRSVFARVEDTGAYGWTFVTLLGLVMLIGFAQVKTGLIDRTVDEQTERQLAELEKSQGDTVDRIALRDQMVDVRKAGEFNKLITRLGAMLAAPVWMAVSLLLIASLLYAVVALTGRKPEYHTLMSICVFAAFIELAAHILRLGMMLYFRTVEVDTSLGALASPGKPSFLAAIDPFHIWFWVLVAMGLVVTHQLSRRVAVLACLLFGGASIGVRIGMAYGFA